MNLSRPPTARTARVRVPIRLAGVFAVGVTAALGLAACSGSGSDGGLGALAKSRDATLAQHTAVEAATVNTSAGGGPASLSGTGGFDFAARQGRFSVTLPAINPLPPGTKADVVVQLPIVYANLKGIPLGAKPWIHIDLRALPNVPGFDVGALRSIELLDPMRPFRWLLGATGTVTTIGRETIDNAATTHERVSVDLAKALSKAAGPDATALQVELTTLDRPTFPIDVWIGPQGLIRKVSYAVTVQGRAGGLATPQSASLQFSSFASPVSATPPPPAETVDLAALLGQLGG